MISAASPNHECRLLLKIKKQPALFCPIHIHNKNKTPSTSTSQRENHVVPGPPPFRRPHAVQPLARAAGRIGSAPFHRADLCLFRVQRATDQAHRHHPFRTGRLDACHRRLGVQHCFGGAGRVCRAVRHLDGARGSAQSHVRGRLLLRCGLSGGRIRRAYPQYLAGVFGQRRDWRRGLGAGLHRPCVHADEVVSRQTRHGHRLGDYGLRRRRNAGFAAIGGADAHVCRRAFRRRGGNVRCAGRAVFRAHAVRRVHHPRPRRRLETEGLHCAVGQGSNKRHAKRQRGRSGENAAVLAALLHPVPEHHRRHRRFGAGQRDDSRAVFRNLGGGGRGGECGGSGRVRGAFEPVQHGRALFLVVHFRQAGAQKRLYRLFRAGRDFVLPDSQPGRKRQQSPVHYRLLRDYFHVRRRICRHSGVSARFIRHLPSGRDSRPNPAGVVAGGGAGPRVGELYPPRAD